VAVVIMGAAIAWLAFSDAGKYEALLGSERLSGLRLPWDPVLATGPETEGLQVRADAPAAVSLQLITADTSARDQARRVASSVGRAGSVAVPTSYDVRLHDERSLRWHREQRLVEAGNLPNDPEDGSSSSSESEEEDPNDDP
jgi:hypothetical protein